MMVNCHAQQKSRYLIQRYDKPYAENAPFQHISRDDAERYPHNPDSKARNIHGHSRVPGRPDGAIINTGQILRNLYKSHNKYIDRPDGLQLGVIGHQSHKSLRQHDQQQRSTDADPKSYPD